MDLYHLHRPNPPAPQQAAPPSKAEPQDLYEQAVRHAAHWKGETEKMDRIAREAMAKVEAKRAAKRALKAQLDAAGKEAQSWRERYNELARSQKELMAGRPAPDELREMRAQLEAAESERPAVLEKLRAGGLAFRELQTLKPALAAHEQTIQQLRAQLAAPAQLRQLELDVVAGKEKLRAATQDASAKAAKLAACTDMLMRAEQVLKTCSQLHSGSEDAAPLAEALAETTANIAQFLQTLR